VRITVDEVDRATVERFEAELAEHAPGPFCLIVDLSAVRFLDASGVDALFVAGGIMRRHGGRLAIRGASGVVRRVLVAVGLHQLFDPPEGGQN
jgi:anti-anti-sigma factor